MKGPERWFTPGTASSNLGQNKQVMSMSDVIHEERVNYRKLDSVTNQSSNQLNLEFQPNRVW